MMRLESVVQHKILDIQKLTQILQVNKASGLNILGREVYTSEIYSDPLCHTDSTK